MCDVYDTDESGFFNEGNNNINIIDIIMHDEHHKSARLHRFSEYSINYTLEID